MPGDFLFNWDYSSEGQLASELADLQYVGWIENLTICQVLFAI